MLIIGERLRLLRVQKELSQGDIQARTGLLRCYVSRVENGHTIPSLETLEKLARALDLSLYQFLYDGEEPPLDSSSAGAGSNAGNWGRSGKNRRFLSRLNECLARVTPDDRELLLHFAEQIAERKRKRPQ